MYQSMDFLQSNEYDQLVGMTNCENLYMMPYDFRHDGFSQYSGTYLVIMPNSQCSSDLIANKEENIIKLLKQKREFGEERFNPYYNIIDISHYPEGNNFFSLFMQISREIEKSSIVINAFRECGYSRFPMVMDDFTVKEIKHIRDMANNTKLDPRIRERYVKAYPKYIESVYQHYIGLEKEMARPLSEHQMVKEKFFIENGISTMHDRVDQNFRPFFLQEVCKHPEFIYCLSDKPVVDVKDAAHLWRGNPLDNPLKDRTEIKKWDITFPTYMQDIFYSLMNEYNTIGCKQKVRDMSLLGPYTELFSIHVPREDIYRFDDMCAEKGIQYYVNRGDLEYCGPDATRNIKLAVRKADAEQLHEIIAFIMRNIGLEETFPVEDLHKIKEIMKSNEKELEINPNFEKSGKKDFYSIEH